MLKCFGDLIGQTIEANVDDIVVKSKWAAQVVDDLEQTFMKLQANSIKLNPGEVRFRGPKGYAAGFYRHQAWHQSQPEEDLGHHKDGPNLVHKGGTTSYRVPRRAQPLYLAPRRMRSPPLSAPKEGRPF